MIAPKHVLMFRYSKRTYVRGDIMQPHVSEVIHGPAGFDQNGGLDGQAITYLTDWSSLFSGWLDIKFGWRWWENDKDPCPVNVYLVRVDIDDAEPRHINSDLMQWIARKPVAVVDMFAYKGQTITREMEAEAREYDLAARELLDCRNPDDDIDDLDRAEWEEEKEQSALPTAAELEECETYELRFEDD